MKCLVKIFNNNGNSPFQFLGGRGGPVLVMEMAPKSPSAEVLLVFGYQTSACGGPRTELPVPGVGTPCLIASAAAVLVCAPNARECPPSLGQLRPCVTVGGRREMPPLLSGLPCAWRGSGLSLSEVLTAHGC